MLVKSLETVLNDDLLLVFRQETIHFSHLRRAVLVPVVRVQLHKVNDPHERVCVAVHRDLDTLALLDLRDDL